VTKTERKLPISDAEVAARLRSTTQRALADELAVSKTAIAKAVARHKRLEERRHEVSHRTSAARREYPVEGEPELMANAPVNVRERLDLPASAPWRVDARQPTRQPQPRSCMAAW
jgi:hypothetical protein